MARPSPQLIELLHRAIDGAGVEVSLSELMGLAEYDSANVLDRLQELERLLIDLRLDARPPISVGGDDDVRVLVYGNATQSFGQRLTSLIGLGEQVAVEFKSTAFVAVRQVREQGLSARDCESEGVLGAVLKTVCGFLNKSGGELYIGVEPSGVICGLDLDYELLPATSRDFDGWANRLQDKLRSRFYEASRVMAYIDFDHELVGGVPVCRVRVRPRSRLSFVKDAGGIYRCYVRQNVRTEEVKIEELPDFLEARELMR